ncbi:(2Fe-2S)-binding protein [Streptomyces pristinaespiralis]|uniref:(2Fe-2S)-binding protein n=1 Tax=Streptomyces pristinaespiralis TaxID=38300 RepID=UPI0033E2A119
MTMATGTATAGPAVTAASALARTYRELVGSCEALNVRIASAAPAARLDGAQLDGVRLVRSQEALDAFIDAEAARIRERHGHEPRRDVAASRALHDYLWSVSLLMSGPWYLERRVPRVAPQDVRIDVAAAAFEIVPGSGFACLPDDPAAGTPGVRVVAHEEALRAELRAAVADHAGPLLAAVGPHARRRSRALWGMAADDLVSGIWYLGRMLDQEDRAIRAATELLPTAVPPFPGGADFRRLAGRDGRRHPTRTRLGCCMYYTLDAARACSTCPRTCDAERLRRLEEGG